MFSTVSSVRCGTLFKVIQMRGLCTSVLLVGGICSAQSQTHPSLGGWRLSAGWQDYREPQMQLKGPELGLHWQSRILGSYRFEADAHVGLQNYNSAQSGRLDHVLNIDTRVRAFRALSTQPQWLYGLALHTHANFLRGTTSLGFVGYDRLSAQVWLPVRWKSLGDQPWAVDAGWLLWGEHASRLSQVNARLQDVTNTQRRGVYLQVSQKISSSKGDFEPYARWTKVDDSDIRPVTVDGQNRGAYEPQNNRVNLGVKWQFR